MTTPTATRENTLLLAGLDGGNLLAFLAALGTLRMLHQAAGMPVRMSWAPSGGTWRPSLHFTEVTSQDDVLDLLVRDTTAGNHPSLAWSNWKNATESRRALFATVRAAASAADRPACDWLCAIGSDVPDTEDTPLRAPRTDYLLGNIRKILADTKRQHLCEALFAPWTYSDPLDNCSLKFEPSEDRRHAFQWYAPSGDPNRKKSGNVLGANRLALEAMPLFPCVLTARRLASVACHRPRTAWEITWSLWREALSLDVARSVLTLPDLLAQPVGVLRARGLLAVFRCHRLTIGKTRVFTPSRRLA